MYNIKVHVLFQFSSWYGKTCVRIMVQRRLFRLVHVCTIIRYVLTDTAGMLGIEMINTEHHICPKYYGLCSFETLFEITDGEIYLCVTHSI